MCDIEYEEFDNKESIIQELRNMIIEKEISQPSLKKEEILRENAESNDNHDFVNKPLEFTKPVRMSELYSNYSLSWQEKLNSNEIITENSEKFSSMEHKRYDKDSYRSDSDINDEESIVRLPIAGRIQLETTSCSHDDEVSKRVESNIKKPVTVKMVTTSSGYSFDDENELKLSNNENGTPPILTKPFTLTKKKLVETGCDGLDDNSIPHKKSICRNPASRNVAVASFGNSFDANEHVTEKKQSMITTSTETETDEKPPMESSLASQANETYNRLEEKILPFIRNPKTVELKLLGRLSVFQNACVKQIASQHKLLMKSFGKGHDSFILLRKKIEMLDAQKEFLERKKAELQKKKERTALIKAKEDRILNPPKTVSSGCQVDLLSNEPEKPHLSKNEIRRNRKLQWEQKQKQKMKKSSSSQTIEKGFYVCPYCEDDIPEALQFIHYPHCLEKYRSMNQSKMKSGAGDNHVKFHRPNSSQKKARSKSRDKLNQSKIDSLKKELEKVHSNDINAIVNIVNELDKKCASSNCNKKKRNTCPVCLEGFCFNHFSPDGEDGNIHFNCPVALERAGSEQQKLGVNNPLLKTIEQLSTPQFPDGAMIKHKKRVAVIDKVREVNDVDESPAQMSQNMTSPSINQTRTRNGPLLSYERNNLRKDLRERIALLTDRRSK